MKFQKRQQMHKWMLLPSPKGHKHLTMSKPMEGEDDGSCAMCHGAGAIYVADVWKLASDKRENGGKFPK